MDNVSKNETNTIIVTLALFVGTFLSAISGTIVSTAMPTIGGDLNGISLTNWVLSIYLLTSAIAIPIYGKISDLIGRKRVLITGLGAFALGSLLSGFANSMQTLIIWRAFQGIGAGVILPLAYTIIADIYPFSKRSKVIGLNSAGWGISAVIAPLLGGFILDNFSWRYIFLLNVPISLIIMGLIYFYFKEDSSRKNVSIDYLGIIYLIVILLSIMFMIQLIGDRNIDLAKMAFLFIVLVVSAVLFIRREHAFHDPIIPMEMFKHRSFVIQNAVTFFISGFVMCIDIYVPNWIQGLMGQRASIAGLSITPIAIFWIIGAFISGWLLRKITAKDVTTTGIAVILIASCLLVGAVQNLSLLNFFLITSLAGIGFGIVMTNNTIVVQEKVDDSNVGAATSFNVLCRTVGQTLFTTIFGIFMSTSLRVGTLQISGTSMKLLNKLMNPVYADNLSPKLVVHLKTILFDALHNVFLVGMFVVIISLLINLMAKSTKKDKA
ncbi:MDR family MFS transporter [Lactobacillaceae bacterium Scapto_B20]